MELADLLRGARRDAGLQAGSDPPDLLLELGQLALFETELGPGVAELGVDPRRPLDGALLLGVEGDDALALEEPPEPGLRGPEEAALLGRLLLEEGSGVAEVVPNPLPVVSRVLFGVRPGDRGGVLGGGGRRRDLDDVAVHARGAERDPLPEEVVGGRVLGEFVDADPCLLGRLRREPAWLDLGQHAERERDRPLEEVDLVLEAAGRPPWGERVGDRVLARRRRRLLDEHGGAGLVHRFPSGGEGVREGGPEEDPGQHGGPPPPGGRRDEQDVAQEAPAGSGQRGRGGAPSGERVVGGRRGGHGGEHGRLRNGEA